ncbi:hypothetical protein SRABI106_03839 [Rahnella aquatilis]|nr:hypothetical protein SRABI106_03839 [Rahnella aquatilis]
MLQRGDVTGFISRSAALAKLGDHTGDNAWLNRFPRLAVGVHQKQGGIVDDVPGGNVFHRAGKLNLIAQNIADGLAAAEFEHRNINAGLLGFQSFKTQLVMVVDR